MTLIIPEYIVKADHDRIQEGRRAMRELFNHEVTRPCSCVWDGCEDK